MKGSSIITAMDGALYRVKVPMGLPRITVALSSGTVWLNAGSTSTMRLGDGDVATLFKAIPGVKIRAAKAPKATADTGRGREIRVNVGAVDAVTRPGPDGEFGTPDDQHSIESARRGSPKAPRIGDTSAESEAAEEPNRPQLESKKAKKAKKEKGKS
jgi:nucleoid-associated protein YgaU